MSSLLDSKRCSFFFFSGGPGDSSLAGKQNVFFLNPYILPSGSALLLVSSQFLCDSVILAVKWEKSLTRLTLTHCGYIGY